MSSVLTIDQLRYTEEQCTSSIFHKELEKWKKKDKLLSNIEASGSIDYDDRKTKLEKNIDRLLTIMSFKSNWDGYGSEAFDKKLIKRCIHIIQRIRYQPKVFPTGRDSIQFEYEKKNGHYLEFEIYENGDIGYLEMIPLDKASEKNLDSEDQIYSLVNKFYEK